MKRVKEIKRWSKPICYNSYIYFHPEEDAFMIKLFVNRNRWYLTFDSKEEIEKLLEKVDFSLCKNYTKETLLVIKDNLDAYKSKENTLAKMKSGIFCECIKESYFENKEHPCIYPDRIVKLLYLDPNSVIEGKNVYDAIFEPDDEDVRSGVNTPAQLDAGIYRYRDDDDIVRIEYFDIKHIKYSKIHNAKFQPHHKYIEVSVTGLNENGGMVCETYKLSVCNIDELETICEFFKIDDVHSRILEHLFEMSRNNTCITYETNPNTPYEPLIKVSVNTNERTDNIGIAINQFLEYETYDCYASELEKLLDKASRVLDALYY